MVTVKLPWQALFLVYVESSSMNNARLIIDRLQLQPHPEGGFYKEIYRAAELIPVQALADRYNEARNTVTSIYFLLEHTDKSRYHRLLSDEIWFFHAGNPVEIFFLSENEGLKSATIGPFPLPQQLLIPKNTWFAAQPQPGETDFTLVSCVVAPGFHFDDFELAEKTALIAAFPDHAEHIIAYS